MGRYPSWACRRSCRACFILCPVILVQRSRFPRDEIVDKTVAALCTINRERFLQADPVRPRPEEMNAYVYVVNNPINYNDPTGMFLRGCQPPCAVLIKRCVESRDKCISDFWKWYEGLSEEEQLRFLNKHPSIHGYLMKLCTTTNPACEAAVACMIRENKPPTKK